ncbi:hypothetical protein [Cohnella fermenti]|uniref:DUF3888 domain-containing protein n=1 Tax=Cohnella fermenti TaxID=2565925 RepID=A0A4S4C9Y9_9BACL|nr:hypothetical protein [Cohnella fermenti]THF82650.1 hypothetical protein E6C55_06160 [Cohnella fermenti]
MKLLQAILLAGTLALSLAAAPPVSASGASVLNSAIPVQEPSSRERELEAALLQQLHPAIVESLRGTYRERYVQFGCERIASINERGTAKRHADPARPVDAVHGAKFFEITVSICRPNGERVELDMRNDGMGTGTGYVVTATRIVSKSRTESRPPLNKPDTAR